MAEYALAYGHGNGELRLGLEGSIGVGVKDNALEIKVLGVGVAGTLLWRSAQGVSTGKALDGSASKNAAYLPTAKPSARLFSTNCLTICTPTVNFILLLLPDSM